MSIRVRLGAGSGIELLMAAVAVADADWRSVIHRGPGAYDAARAAGGRDLLRDVARFGRFGWINLAGPLTEQRGAWTVEALRQWVEATEPEELRLVLTTSPARPLWRAIVPLVRRGAARSTRPCSRSRPGCWRPTRPPSGVPASA